MGERTYTNIQANEQA